MFRKNDSHLQSPLFSSLDELPPKLQKRLEASWAGVFYHGFFCQIDEAPFASSYAEDILWPNVPVNVLVGLRGFEEAEWAGRMKRYAANVAFGVICRCAMR